MRLEICIGSAPEEVKKVSHRPWSGERARCDGCDCHKQTTEIQQKSHSPGDGVIQKSELNGGETDELTGGFANTSSWNREALAMVRAPAEAPVSANTSASCSASLGVRNA